MPTGYTAKLYEGEQTLKEFALECSKAFVRDSSLYAENIKQSYVKLKNAESMLVVLKSINVEQEYKLHIQKEQKQRLKQIEEMQQLKLRYTRMLEQVERLELPEQYNIFKQFMTDQLKEAISFDCYHIPEYDVPSMDAWYQTLVNEAEQDLQYYSEVIERSSKNLTETNKFLSVLENL